MLTVAPSPPQDLLLSTLRTDEPITMAINSGRLPVLLPSTVQLVHSSELLRQQGMAARAASLAPTRALSMKESMPPPASPADSKAQGDGTAVKGEPSSTEGLASPMEVDGTPASGGAPPSSAGEAVSPAEPMQDVEPQPRTQYRR